MLQPRGATVSKFSVSVPAILVLVIVFVVGLFLVGFDQGHALSIIQGPDAFEENFLHELFHDTRHAAGFPCH